MKKSIRIGIDLGGTKIEALALSPDGGEICRIRIATPRDYEGSLQAITQLVHTIESDLNAAASVGIGMPGAIRRASGTVKNANSTWLNGRMFQKAISAALGREVRCANDANCLAVSEAVDGSGAGFPLVFAAILGTGCGGGLAINGRIHEGRNNLAGEWGHVSLPWPRREEIPGPACYCGQRGCLETWISGTALSDDFTQCTGIVKSGQEIAGAAEGGDPEALAAVTRLEDRIGRGLAMVVDIVDPDVIVLGGGVSRLGRLYTNLPRLVERYSFGGGVDTPILPAKHGDSSGVRGAAWLWPPSHD